MKSTESLTIWQKIGMFFYTKRPLTAFLWLAVIITGVMSYTTWMRREGFPGVDVPIGVVQVISFNKQASAVDEQFVLPILDRLKDDSSVKDITTRSSDQGASVVISYNDGTDVQAELDSLKGGLEGTLPKDSQLIYLKVDASKLTNEGDDILLSVYSNEKSNVELDEAAEKVASYLKTAVPLAERVSRVNLIETVVDPASGTETSQQVRFERYYNAETKTFERAAIVAVKGVTNVDQLKLYDQVEAVLESDEIHDLGVHAAVSASFAESIREQISGLQRNLLEGLAVVLVVSFILISLRGSVITALAMTTTVITTVGILHLLGYTLNTITLFSLVLCLALIVDDTTIVVEAIDAGLKKGDKFGRVVKESFRRVARASATGTAVTILAFAPMLFIGGVLGKFIRAIPVTIIISLAVSIVVSFVFIPLMMRLSYGKLRDGKVKNKVRIADKVEAKIGNTLAKVIVYSTKTKRNIYAFRIGSVLASLAVLMAGGFIFSRVEFNIFPAAKDGNDISISGSVIDQEMATIEGTEKYTDEALAAIREVAGDNLVSITLSGQGTYAGRNGFGAAVRLTDYGKRDITSVEIAEKIQERLNELSGMRYIAGAAGVGPPAGGFAVQIDGTNPELANTLAKDIQTFINNVELKRPDGTIARLKDARITPQNTVVRDNAIRVVEVSADFEDSDTSALVALAQTAVEDEFTSERLASEYKLSGDVIRFDFGQEEENQDSFASMGQAAGPLLLAMFILMALLFKSIMQPVLIFTALPFAFFGVASGLYLTDNPISFFSMLGVFALIGISLNNTILLTDYANQAQVEGKKPVDAIASAVRERLRPLLTTSITSVFALLPLALNDPFWEGLSFALIFGLISSTVLVLLLFPYFYLISESIAAKFTALWRRVVKTKR